MCARSYLAQINKWINRVINMFVYITMFKLRLNLIVSRFSEYAKKHLTTSKKVTISINLKFFSIFKIEWMNKQRMEKFLFFIFPNFDRCLLFLNQNSKNQFYPAAKICHKIEQQLLLLYYNIIGKLHYLSIFLIQKIIPFIKFEKY